MRILILTCRPPWRARRGDQARALGLAKCWAGRHRVHVVSQAWPGFETGGDEGELDALTGESVSIGRSALVRALSRGAVATTRRAAPPLQVALHDQPRFRAAVRRAVERFQPEVALVVLSRLGGVLDLLEGIPTVVDLVDSLALNMQRRAAFDPVRAPLWRWEARRLAAWDVRVASAAAAVTVVAERDRRALLSAAAAPRVLAPSVHVMPFGLDLSADRTGSGPLDAEVPRPEQMALTGNLGYFPTVDGALWLAREVWPRLKRLRPELRWVLAGARPARALRRLAAGDPRIDLIADPPSLEAVLARTDVALAPLRAGSGTPIKILEAMAARRPVVATAAAADGLDGLPDGALALGGDSATFADQCAALLSDRVRADRQAAAAAGWLRSRHALETVAADFEQLLEDTVRSR